MHKEFGNKYAFIYDARVFEASGITRLVKYDVDGNVMERGPVPR